MNCPRKPIHRLAGPDTIASSTPAYFGVRGAAGMGAGSRRRSRGALLRVLSISAVSILAGCGVTLPGGTTVGPPGDSFKTAAFLPLKADGTQTLSGSIAGDRVDVYDLGPVVPGDRLVISVEPAAGSLLDPTLAVFDGNEELFAFNDDRDLAAQQFGSAIDDVIVTASDHCFIAIGKFSFDPNGGAYDASVRIEHTGQVPTPAVQVLLLDFDGGAFTIENEGSFNLSAFDASDIDAAYAGKTAQIKARIAEVVRARFRDTGLQIVTTDENPSLTPGTFSTIHFGSFSATKFGVADGVDQGNRDLCDDGIVFIERFDDPFASQPTDEGIAVAIGNVAAHEAGHLLGLNHVADITALMDNTGTASTLLADQVFKTAPLSPSIFPFGKQNAPAILQRVVP